MRRRTRRVEVDGYDVPPELTDPDAPVWHDRAAYFDFMAERGWHLPASERFGVPTHPANRRSGAAAQWAVDVGITDDDPWSADWHQLRAMGLVL